MLDHVYKINEAFHQAIEDQDLPAVQRLLDQGASLSFEEGAQTPLMRAARLGSLPIVRLLVEHKADVNAVSEKNGMTALMAAIYFVKPANVNYLLSKGAKVNVAEEHGLTPLIFAVRTGRYDIVKTLLKHGSRVNDRWITGQTALGMAKDRAWEPYANAVKLLMKYGAKE